MRTVFALALLGMFSAIAAAQVDKGDVEIAFSGSLAHRESTTTAHGSNVTNPVFESSDFVQHDQRPMNGAERGPGSGDGVRDHQEIAVPKRLLVIKPATIPGPSCVEPPADQQELHDRYPRGPRPHDDLC